MLIKTLFVFFLVISLNANDYQKWLDSQDKEYTNYKKSIDEEFVDMLKKDWKAFQTMSTPSTYKKPKPTVIPKVIKKSIVPKKDIENSPKIIIKPLKVKLLPKTIVPKK